ncbi:hypothetical protein MAR_017133 [Mya arenaria]|uniref:Uncharacterized protein n=1 Tax=Mya arenaria TaxID=6604 RepID=A0ABY7EAW1_MYAAR|nr:hypothetical protein MAR_017133 [Mya arenaria]
MDFVNCLYDLSKLFDFEGTRVMNTASSCRILAVFRNMHRGLGLARYGLFSSWGFKGDALNLLKDRPKQKYQRRSVMSPYHSGDISCTCRLSRDTIAVHQVVSVLLSCRRINRCRRLGGKGTHDVLC